MGINMLLDGAGKVLETVPEVYDDVAKDIAQGTGKTLGLIPRTINAALVPLRIWIEKREYNLEETKKLLAIKLENVDPDKITTPEPYIAVPALQSISYCMDDESLRNMYANLLAAAMNADTKERAHPSFVEKIKQMSPVDASNLAVFPEGGQALPLVNIKIDRSDSEGSHPLERNVFISNPIYQDLKRQAASIDLLETLGLIKTSFLSWFNDDSVYKQFEETSIYKNHLNTSIAGKLSFDMGIVYLTDLGQLFVSTCLR